MTAPAADICCICGCGHYNTRRDLCRSCQAAMCAVMQERNLRFLEGIWV